MESEAGCGSSISESCETSDRDGSSSRTSEPYGQSGCPSCGATCTPSGIPACRFECPPLTSGSLTTETESSLWPTPTAKANHFAPYMRRWPAYSRLQDEIGKTRGPRVARLFLAMMDFPPDWLDCLATACRPLFPK